jgi:aquaporin Z
MIHQIITEFLGTLFLTFIILASRGNWLAIGGALAIGVLLGGRISGAAYNPAVAIAYFSAGKIAPTQLAAYIVAEIAGALAALQLVKMVRL